MKLALRSGPAIGGDTAMTRTILAAILLLSGCASPVDATRTHLAGRVVDCGYVASGTSTAKGAHTVVENTALLP